jgi:hypothetical protein
MVIRTVSYETLTIFSTPPTAVNETQLVIVFNEEVKYVYQQLQLLMDDAKHQEDTNFYFFIKYDN